MRYSNCREIVANHADVSGGAVPPLALAQARGATGKRLLSAEILARSVQLVRCQRFSRLCVLMNPILPGSRSIRTWPAKCLKKLVLRSGQFRGDARGELVQLTNLRMRTFIAAPSARNVNKTEDPP
jgi:hypothetical protein